MQNDPRSPEPPLATLLAFVAGVFCVTGVFVSSYLAEDATRQAVPSSGFEGAWATGRAGAKPESTGAPCADLTDLGSPSCRIQGGQVPRSGSRLRTDPASVDKGQSVRVKVG